MSHFVRCFGKLLCAVLIFSLVVGSAVPAKQVVAAPLAYEREYPAYPWMGPSPLPCVNNYQQQEFPAKTVGIGTRETLSFRLKVLYCNDDWELSVEAGSGAVLLTGISAQTLGIIVGVSKEGGFTGGIEYQENEVESGWDWYFDGHCAGWLTFSKLTRKADLGPSGLQLAASIVRERRQCVEDRLPENQNLAYAAKPIVYTGFGLIVFFYSLGGNAINLGKTSTGIFIPEDILQNHSQFGKKLMTWGNPSLVMAYEGYVPPSRAIPANVKYELQQKYGVADLASLTELSAPSQVQPGQTFSFSGWGFLPNGEVLVTFGRYPYDDTVAMVLTADSIGDIQGQITLPSAGVMVSGDYLLSAIDSTSVQYTAQKLLNNPTTNPKLYMAGAVVKVVGGTASSNPTHSLAPQPAPELTCSRVAQFDMRLAYLFSGKNCGGDLSWFSAHPSNGPSASGQQSLFVPTGAVVMVSSNDDGGGDRACFDSTVTDLTTVGWTNRIQWAQVVPNTTCAVANPTPAPARYVVHTNDGDFTVSVGQTWDNQQHNRQIMGFDKHGDAHLVINHKGGASRCWDESKSASSLHSDGDWWLQTKSIQVGSGSCPGNNGELIIYKAGNYGGGEHSRVRAGTSREYPDNDLKYSFKFTQSGMSAVLRNQAGRERCWNSDVTSLQDHEDYWHRTLQVKVYGTNVCPPPRLPSPPSNLVVTVKQPDQVTLTWTNDYGYNGGTIIWAKYPGQSSYIGTLSVGEGVTSFTYFAASCNQPVSFYVEAVDSDGRRAQSEVVTATTSSCTNLVAPTNFRATPLSYNSVRVDWDNNQVGNYHGYLISYQKDDGSWAEWIASGVGHNYYNIQGIACHKPWTLAVASYQNATRSPKSTPVTFTLPNCPTAAPQNFAAVMDGSVARLTWTAQPFATGYTIEYSYNGAAFQPFTMGITTSYPWSGFSCNSTITLRLSANTPYGQSAKSEITFNSHPCVSGSSLSQEAAPEDNEQQDDANLEASTQVFLPLISR